MLAPDELRVASFQSFWTKVKTAEVVTNEIQTDWPVCMNLLARTASLVNIRFETRDNLPSEDERY